MKIVAEKNDMMKLKQLVITVDANEFCNGSGRVTICASVVSSGGHTFVLRDITLDIPKIEFPPPSNKIL